MFPSLSTLRTRFSVCLLLRFVCVMDEAGLGGSGVNSFGDVEDVVVDSGGPGEAFACELRAAKVLVDLLYGL